MTKTIHLTIFGLMLLIPLHQAAAFSTESNTAQNSDGSPKFADPDEQMPRFMVSPGNANAAAQSLSFGTPGTTLPSMRDNDGGADAFDHAFAHQQSDR